MNTLDRRRFLRDSLAATTTAGFLGLCHSASAAAEAAAANSPYGPILPDPKRILDLPKGFAYTVVSKVGDPMHDGLSVPGRMDGMGAFPHPSGDADLVLLVRNHESQPRITTDAFKSIDEARERQDHFYDFGLGKTPHPGGTTTVLYNTRARKTLHEHQSLFGTLRNCAGGTTPWNTWITCEESVVKAGVHPTFGFHSETHHGYNFEVPREGIAKPVPLKAMGRFNHEAVAVDPRTSIVYQTEDRHEGLFYRYIPNTPRDLAGGGKLQALVVRGQASLDTRNWDKKLQLAPGTRLATQWIDLDDVESPKDDLRFRGFKAGAARFARGEGIWHADPGFFFACTNGGRKQAGQIWHYIPSPAEGTPEEAAQPGHLELFIEPNDKAVVNNADNLTVCPWGGLMVCEDHKGTCRLIGVTPEGTLYPFAANRAGGEVAGATFSPDGKTLFVNLQIAGYTLAIHGPWSAEL